MRFYHGTPHQLVPGSFLTPEGAEATGRRWALTVPGFVYLTSRTDIADHYGRPREWMGENPDTPTNLYEVEPTGEMETDPLGDTDATGTVFRTRYPVRVLELVR